MTADAYERAGIENSVEDRGPGARQPRADRPVTKIDKDKSPELARPNAKIRAAMEEARVIKAGQGKHFETAKELIEALEGRKFVK